MFAFVRGEEEEEDCADTTQGRLTVLHSVLREAAGDAGSKRTWSVDPSGASRATSCSTGSSESSKRLPHALRLNGSG